MPLKCCEARRALSCCVPGPSLLFSRRGCVVLIEFDVVICQNASHVVKRWADSGYCFTFRQKPHGGDETPPASVRVMEIILRRSPMFVHITDFRVLWIQLDSIDEWIRWIRTVDSTPRFSSLMCLKLSKEKQTKTLKFNVYWYENGNTGFLEDILF